MKNPVLFSKHKKSVFGFLILFIISFIGMQYTGNFLKNSVSPAGIVSFEFAKTPENVHKIIDTWKQMNVMHMVNLNMYIDFIFLIAYVGLIWQLILYVSKPDKLNAMIIFLPFIGGFFDVIENIFMLLMLKGSFIDELSQITFYIAAIKFTIIGLAILLVIFKSLLLGFNRLKNAR